MTAYELWMHCGEHTHLFVRRFDPRHKDTVAVHKLCECVAYGVSGSADPNGLHHARIAQLPNTQLSVK